MIRKATVRDVKAIHRLLKKYADRGELLPRALGELYGDVREFCLFEDECDGSIIGCCGVHVYWEDLAEIRSLAVCEKHQREGIGSGLITAALGEASELGITRVFTLTYRCDFFEKHGFRIVDKLTLPQKVWADCIKCVKFPDCDEIAMLKCLGGV
ncbi:MAG: acetyltransferase [Desulfobacterales bacterium C00003060]|nr:MAG: acetyltransferase [Desulfobacterales bacterium S3730MH5]OEU76754.1 MAG: acetyltransferase [Desulfobacterales bacterium C00003060]